MVQSRNEVRPRTSIPPVPEVRTSSRFGAKVLVVLGLILWSMEWGRPELLGQAPAPKHDPALIHLLQAERSTPGSEELQTAWRTVSQWPADRLVEVLAAADEANPVSLHWLRTAIDGMLEQPNFKTPISELQQVVQDRERKFAARRIAWDLLAAANPELMESITESLIADPIAVFRRPAIEKRVALANGLEKKSAERKRILLEAFQAARDEDQVGQVARVLDLEFGEKPDLAKHFGYLVNWHVVGPFPNIGEAGFHESFSPEKILLSDFDGDGRPSESLEYSGNGGMLRWQPHAAVNDTGELDLNKILGKEKEVVGYGVAVFDCSEERPAEIRLRMQNAFKLWLNGELLQSQSIGHTGNAFDQYAIPVTLKQGKNLILIKSCQNKPPQEIEWYDTWHFNVRICDKSGTAIQEQK